MRERTYRCRNSRNTMGKIPCVHEGVEIREILCGKISCAQNIQTGIRTRESIEAYPAIYLLQNFKVSFGGQELDRRNQNT